MPSQFSEISFRVEASREHDTVHVSHDGFGMVLVQRLALAHSLIKERQADLPGTDNGNDFFQPRHLSRVGRLVPQHPYMMGQASAVGVVGPFTQKVEHLRESEGHKKVIGGVRIADKEKQRRFFIPQPVKLQLVIGHDLPKLGNVKGSKSGSAANQYALSCLARDKLSRTF